MTLSEAHFKRGQAIAVNPEEHAVPNPDYPAGVARQRELSSAGSPRPAAWRTAHLSQYTLKRTIQDKFMP